MKKFQSYLEFTNEQNEIIDWDKLEAYWNKLLSSEKFKILSKDDFADPNSYKNSKFNDMPSPVQNNLLKYLPKFVK
jgi:hypothetical protein